MKLIERIEKILSSVDEYQSTDGLLKNKIIEDALKLEPKLIGLLHDDAHVRDKFFIKIKGGGKNIR